MLLAAALVLPAGSTPAQTLPWEVTVAEVEAGRLRFLAERLNKQYVLYQLRLGTVRKADMVATATQIDRAIEVLERGSSSQSIPAPWTLALKQQLLAVDRIWGPIRRIAVASPYEQMRVSQEFVPADDRRGDPLLIRYFDNLTGKLVGESEKLLGVYDAECRKTGLEVCPVAMTSGHAEMLIQRATKEAVYVIAGIESEDNRKRLRATLEAYADVQRVNDGSPFFASALDPERGVSARAAGQLLLNLREDWGSMQAQFTILAAGDEGNFDIQRLLATEARLVDKIERLAGALVRYASVTYGS